jgi:hypothetical protein
VVLHQVHLDPALGDLVGELHPDEAAADYDYALHTGHHLAEEAVHIVVVLVDGVYPFEVGPRDGGHEGARAGGDHQALPTDAVAAGKGGRARLAVDGFHPVHQQLAPGLEERQLADQVLVGATQGAENVRDAAGNQDFRLRAHQGNSLVGGDLRRGHPGHDAAGTAADDEDIRAVLGHLMPLARV